MKKTILLLFFFCGLISQMQAQEVENNKWSGHLSIGQYAASLGTPKFTPLHLGIKAGVNYQWNNNEKHQFVQSGNLAYFYHQNFQHAIQLYSEVGYNLQLRKGWQINPFSIGGGYVLSIFDMTTVKFNEETETFETVNVAARNNWVISLGAGIGYTSNLKIKDRPITFLLDYRLQVQGIIMRNNIPFGAYAPLMLGVSLPL